MACSNPDCENCKRLAAAIELANILHKSIPLDDDRYSDGPTVVMALAILMGAGVAYATPPKFQVETIERAYRMVDGILSGEVQIAFVADN